MPQDKELLKDALPGDPHPWSLQRPGKCRCYDAGIESLVRPFGSAERDIGQGPEFYVFLSSVIAQRVAEWFATPKRDGNPRSQDVPKFHPTAEELAAAKDAFAQMLA